MSASQEVLRLFSPAMVSATDTITDPDELADAWRRARRQGWRSGSIRVAVLPADTMRTWLPQTFAPTETIECDHYEFVFRTCWCVQEGRAQCVIVCRGYVIAYDVGSSEDALYFRDYTGARYKYRRHDGAFLSIGVIDSWRF